MSDRPLRLGDVLDDYCPRCRLLLNHDIAQTLAEAFELPKWPRGLSFLSEATA